MSEKTVTTVIGDKNPTALRTVRGEGPAMTKGPHPGPYEAIPTGPGQKSAMVVSPKRGRNGRAAVAVINEFNHGDVNDTAQFIVRACNAHDELVAALESAQDIVSEHIAKKGQWDARLLECVDNISAALAKAQA